MISFNVIPDRLTLCDRNKQQELSRAVPGCAARPGARTRHLAAWYAHYSRLKLCRCHVNEKKKDQRCEKKGVKETASLDTVSI